MGAPRIPCLETNDRSSRVGCSAFDGIFPSCVCGRAGVQFSAQGLRETSPNEPGSETAGIVFAVIFVNVSPTDEGTMKHKISVLCSFLNQWFARPAFEMPVSVLPWCCPAPTRGLPGTLGRSQHWCGFRKRWGFMAVTVWPNCRLPETFNRKQRPTQRNRRVRRFRRRSFEDTG
jgi:hypothetical protein